MIKKNKNILIGIAVGTVIGLIVEANAILLFLIMGAGVGYATTLENVKLKYILMGLFIGGPIGCLIGYLIWAGKYGTPSEPSTQNQDKEEENSPTNKTKNALVNRKKSLSAEEEQIQFCLAVWALAQASCWADGNKGENENNEAKQILKSLMANFTEEQKKTILLSAKQFNEIKSQPLLDDAVVEIEKLNKPDYMILDNVVQRIIRSDNQISESEQKFMDSWQEYMNSKQ